MKRQRQEPAIQVPVSGYSREVFSERRLSKSIDEQEAIFVPPSLRGTFADKAKVYWLWISTEYVRSNLLALRYQKGYRILSYPLIGLASGAAIVASVQTILLPSVVQLEWLEMIILFAIIGLVLLGRAIGPHRRWSLERLLAEKLRSMYYLALLGVDYGPFGSERTAYKGPTRVDDSWARRVVETTWNQRPRTSVVDAEFDQARQLIEFGWIGSQMDYHAARALHYRRLHSIIGFIVMVVFALTVLLVVARLQSFWDLQPAILADLSLGSVMLPLIGGALIAYEGEGEFRKHVERDSRMTEMLGTFRNRLKEDVRDIPDLVALVKDLERVMSREFEEWVGITWSHEISLHL